MLKREFTCVTCDGNGHRFARMMRGHYEKRTCETCGGSGLDLRETALAVQRIERRLDEIEAAIGEKA